MGLDIKRTYVTEEEKVEFVEFITPEDFVYVPPVRSTGQNGANVVIAPSNCETAIIEESKVDLIPDDFLIQVTSAAASLSAADENSPL